MKLKLFFTSTFILSGLGVLLSFVGCTHDLLTTQTVKVGSNWILDVQYSPDGSTLAAIDQQGSLFLIDSTTKTVVNQVIRVDTDEISDEEQARGDNLQLRSVHFSEDGQTLYTCTVFYKSNAGNVEISKWNIQGTAPPSSVFHQPIDRSLQFYCKDQFVGDWFVIPSQSSSTLSLEVYESKTGSHLFSIPDASLPGSYRNRFLSIHFKHGLEPETEQVWDLAQQRKVFETNQRMNLLSISSKEKLLIQVLPSSSQQLPITELSIRDIHNQSTQSLSFPSALGWTYSPSAVFSPDETKVIAGFVSNIGNEIDYYWCIWDLSNSRMIAYKEYAQHQYNPKTIFIPNNKILTLPSSNSQFITSRQEILDSGEEWFDQLWDIDSTEEVVRFSASNPNASKQVFGLDPVLVSPRNAQVVSKGLSSGELLFWDF